MEFPIEDRVSATLYWAYDWFLDGKGKEILNWEI
jgi:hypothetical protein